uniref:Glycosyl transferase n=1 Tax=Bionectria ochroleuca TaxID=29856 RepID=A0A8H7KAL6_BIOOC
MLTKHPMSITGAIATHRRYILLALTSFVLFWVILYSYGDRIDLASIHYPGSHHSKENNTSITIDATKESDGALIPNYLHLIYALKDPKSSFNFHFKDYLSLYGAQHHWHPDRVYLHTNADKEALDRGRSGESGKWTQLILNHPNLIIHNIELQETAGNGLTIQRMEAQTDFVRAKVLNDIGGYYIDFDVHALRDIAPLRHSGYKAVVGIEAGGAVNLGVLLTAPRSQMIKQWVEGMNAAFDGSYVQHANGVCSKIRDHLEGVNSELLVVNQASFHPVEWSDGDKGKRGLFRNYDLDDGTFTNNLTTFSDGDPLPDFAAEQDVDHTLWNAADSYKGPEWAKEWLWTKSYTLHAFRPHTDVFDSFGLEHISPRYVLERRSNYARAVYPMALDMYRRGIISVHDTYTGLP